MSKPQIGFIGIGVMGTPMSGHLAQAGYALTIHDVKKEAAERAAARNADIQVASTPREVAEASDIVITMLPSGVYVQDVALGDCGLIEGLRAGSLLLDTSSSEPWLTLQTAKALNARGIEMVDAPVSGALAGAQAADLVFMVGGSKQNVQRVSPLLEILGNRIFHLGPLGAGHAMKCINNLITAMTFMATAEGLTIGKRFGLDPQVMNDVLNVSTGMSWTTRNHIGQRIISRKFDDPFRLDLMVKDIGIAMKLARNLELPLPLSALGQHLWMAADRWAEKGSSLSHMVSWVGQMTGTVITPGSARDSS